MKLAIISSHPIQYYSPWFKYLSGLIDIHVFYLYKSKKQGLEKDGFGFSFEWDVDLLDGYKYSFLKNISKKPSQNNFYGCDNPEIYKVLKNNNFDAVLIMGWYLKGFVQALIACKMYRIPALVRGDSKLESNQHVIKKVFKKLFFSFFLNLFDVFLYVGKKNKEYLEYFGVPKTKLVFCPHFINQSFFSQNLNNFNKKELIKKMNLRQSSFKLLFVGKFINIKRPLDILKALKILENDAIDFELIFVGSGYLEDKLKMFCKSHANLNVNFLGFMNQSQLPQIYALSDVLILPSESETWGLVVNESFSVLTPALVSDQVGCATDLIDSGKTGEVFKAGNIEDLAKNIKKISSYNNLQNLEENIKAKNKIFSIEYASQKLLETIKVLSKESNE